ncbi:nucleoside 2-deoxyribosyltransferase domain-containing protein [Clostridium botulinum]
MKKVFLGGTCANSKWRNKIVPLLKIDYFNPVVKSWNDEARKREIYEREHCNYVLYTLTRVYSTYSIAEVVDDSNKRPEKTICCIINEKDSKGNYILSKQELKHLDQVGKMIERNGGRYFKTLEEAADYLNNNK